MTIVLDHTIVPVADKSRSARLLAALIGTEPGTPVGPFIPVAVNDQLTLDFDERFGAVPGHYGFHVDDHVFDRVVEHAIVLDLGWGSQPRVVDRTIHESHDGRRVYIRDPDGIAYEFFTRT